MSFAEIFARQRRRKAPREQRFSAEQKRSESGRAEPYGRPFFHRCKGKQVTGKGVFTIFRKKKEPAITAVEYIVAGLGNPGRDYEMTRHNVGFCALDALAEKLGAGRIASAKCKALYALCSHNGKNLLLMKPQTFMNLSGEAVRDMAEAYHVPPEHIIVVYDDIHLAAGRLRVRRHGSAGGHNGIKNIIYQLNSDQFPRIKVGVGGPGEEDLKDFVLSAMDSNTWEGVKRAPDAVIDLIDNGVDSAMQKFNSAG
ncbi:aminoacyl-tRNA hydrolase [Acidaminobacterium chupaoyuni]